MSVESVDITSDSLSQDMSDIFYINVPQAPRLYFFMLNSAEHENLNAHKY